MKIKNIQQKNIWIYKWVINILAGILLFNQLLWIAVISLGMTSAGEPLFLVMKYALVFLFVFILYGVNTNKIIIKNVTTLILLSGFLILFSIFCNYETYILGVIR